MNNVFYYDIYLDHISNKIRFVFKDENSEYYLYQSTDGELFEEVQKLAFFPSYVTYIKSANKYLGMREDKVYISDNLTEWDEVYQGDISIISFNEEPLENGFKIMTDKGYLTINTKTKTAQNHYVFKDQFKYIFKEGNKITGFVAGDEGYELYETDNLTDWQWIKTLPIGTFGQFYEDENKVYYIDYENKELYQVTNYRAFEYVGEINIDNVFDEITNVHDILIKKYKGEYYIIVNVNRDRLTYSPRFYTSYLYRSNDLMSWDYNFTFEEIMYEDRIGILMEIDGMMIEDGQLYFKTYGNKAYFDDLGAIQFNKEVNDILTYYFRDRDIFADIELIETDDQKINKIQYDYYLDSDYLVASYSGGHYFVEIMSDRLVNIKKQDNGYLGITKERVLVESLDLINWQPISSVNDSFVCFSNIISNDEGILLYSDLNEYIAYEKDDKAYRIKDYIPQKENQAYIYIYIY